MFPKIVVFNGSGVQWFSEHDYYEIHNVHIYMFTSHVHCTFTHGCVYIHVVYELILYSLVMFDLIHIYIYNILIITCKWKDVCIHVIHRN